MKITGPGSGSLPEAVGGPEAAENSGSAAGTTAARNTPAGTFADKVAAGARAASVDGGTVSGVGFTADIGADLQAGRITADVALQRVIDRVLDRQIGANAPPALREQLGAALRQTLEDDPLLAEKIRALAPPR